MNVGHVTLEELKKLIRFVCLLLTGGSAIGTEIVAEIYGVDG